MQEGREGGAPEAAVLRTRMLIGLIQGAALCILLQLRAEIAPLMYAALSGVVVLVPMPLLVSIGYMSRRRLILWLAPIAGVVAFVAAHAEWRGQGVAGANSYDVGFALTLMAPLLFIVWSLVLASERDRRWPAAYASYFENAWKLAVQLLFAAVFAGAFWLVMGLGVGLFMMLKIRLLFDLIRHDWFWLPATTLVVAGGLHLTDVRPGIVNGIRNLLLTMLSWLLPLLTVIVAAFLIAVPLAGFELLWKTRFATALLLGACAVLVVLINTAFQDGAADKPAHRLLQQAARLACVLLLPMVLIATYALNLRVGQYGWSPDRIFAAAGIGVAFAYAAGYLWAMVEPLLRRNGEWLPRIASVNLYASLLTVALGLAILSPLADPARLSVNNQLARLASGKTPATQFDFRFLRFDAARYGKAALDQLAADADPVISDKARTAQALNNRWQSQMLPQPVLVEQLQLRTPGKIWPQGFLDTAWASHAQKWQLPACLREPERRCDAFIGNFSGADENEVLLVPQDFGYAAALSDRDGSWQLVTTFELPGKCPKLRDDLAVGRFQRVAPVETDLMVGSTRLRAKSAQPERIKCN